MSIIQNCEQRRHGTRSQSELTGAMEALRSATTKTRSEFYDIIGCLPVQADEKACELPTIVARPNWISPRLPTANPANSQPINEQAPSLVAGLKMLVDAPYILNLPAKLRCSVLGNTDTVIGHLGIQDSIRPAQQADVFGTGMGLGPRPACERKISINLAALATLDALDIQTFQDRIFQGDGEAPDSVSIDTINQIAIAKRNRCVSAESFA